MPKISVIIPIYNEAQYLEKYLKQQIDGLEKLNHTYEIILSENGSTDQTKSIANKIADSQSYIRVIHSKTPNYGHAVKKGFQKANGEYLVLFDLDYFNFVFLKKSLLLLKRYDIVVGSKNSKTSKDQRHLIRRLGSKSFTIILRMLFNYPLHDTHGIKVLKKDKVIPIIKKTKFTKEIFDTELLLRSHRTGLKLTEIPVRVKELRQSRTSIIKRSLKTLPDLFKLRLQFTKESL